MQGGEEGRAPLGTAVGEGADWSRWASTVHPCVSVRMICHPMTPPGPPSPPLRYLTTSQDSASGAKKHPKKPTH